MPSGAPGERKTADAAPLGFGIDASVGDHIVHFYRDSDQKFSILAAYVAEGIRRGDQCLVLGGPKDAENLQAMLAAKGVDLAEACATGKLILHPGEAAKKEMPRLSKEEMLALMGNFEAQARGSGHTLLRWIGDGTWVAGNLSLEHVEWEALADHTVPKWKILVLCQYDLTQSGGDFVMDMLRTHRLCIIGNVLVPNPFCVSHEVVSPEAVAPS